MNFYCKLFLTFFYINSYLFFVINAAATVKVKPQSGMQMAPQKRASVADTLVEAFKCDTGNKKTSNMLQGLNKALAAVKEEDCQAVKQSLNNIPKMQSITQAVQNNQIVRQVKIQEQKIKDIMTEMGRAKDDTQMKGILKNQLDRAKLRFIELNAELAIYREEKDVQKVTDSLDELSTFADTIIKTMNDNRECFEDNQDLTQHAMASVTGIAGLIFSSSPVGMGLMAVSKLAQKIFAVGNTEGKKSATESVKMGIGLRCALQHINSIHCENVKNVDLLDQLTEAESCADCGVPQLYSRCSSNHGGDELRKKVKREGRWRKTISFYKKFS